MKSTIACGKLTYCSPSGVDERLRVIEEDVWREPARLPRDSSEVLVQRWRHDSDERIELVHKGHPSLHCIAMNLKCTSVHFEYSGRTLLRGRASAGVVHASAPGKEISAVFTAPAAMLHFYVTDRVIAEVYERMFKEAPHARLELGKGRLVRDPALNHLALALATSVPSESALGKMFFKNICDAIVTCLVSREYWGPVRTSSESPELPRWRLDRVVEFIDVHLSEPIGVPELASVAGLSRLHFATLFRQSTGLAPHVYLMHRRVEHAKMLLHTTSQSLLSVALNCGFSSQAHFTNVFRRIASDTPLSWRKKGDATLCLA
jgi:AraC family transcriptional regulator